jgi:hypothetical protein
VIGIQVNFVAALPWQWMRCGTGPPRPIGADAVPADLGAAIAESLSHRAELERRFEVEVPRRLGDNVEAGIRRIML